MRQLFQNFNDGKIELLETPRPNVKKDFLIIKSKKSLVSKGTEKMLLEFGKSNLISKALNQPERVKAVINKLKTDGIHSTFKTIQSKLNEPISMGYCNVGEVIESGCKDFKKGDRVVSNGNHAEIVIVHKNLCALIPHDVTDDDAVFTILSSIALNGIRLIKPEIGSIVVVYGLGLIGLITCQLLQSSGCKVIGIDIDKKFTSIASNLGINVICTNNKNEKLNFVNSYSNNYGADAVIITASSKKDDIINESALVTRKKGNVVLIGVINLNLDRSLFYKKEITFQVSSSYGPDRYDYMLNNNQVDLPLHYLRWSVRGNFETCLNLISHNKLKFENFITHKFDLSEYKSAYELINKKSFSLGIILQYQNKNQNINSKTIQINKSDNLNKKIQKIKINFIGSGNYAKTVLLPILNKQNVKLGKLIAQTGFLSSFYGRKFKFEEISTDINGSFNDDSNTCIIVTQHNSHCELIIKALKSNKNVYVEKPLCLNIKELVSIKKAYNKAKDLNPNIKFIVGFNRRFSPHIAKVKNILGKILNPIAINISVNSGKIENDHWIQNKNIGGGRLIGEACHFIDLSKYIVGRKIIKFSKNVMHSKKDDTFTINLKFEDGSIANINYFSNGNKSYPKEKIEIFSNGKIIFIDNFKKMRVYDSKINIPEINYVQDKGQENMIKIFLESIIKQKEDIIPVQDLFEIAEISILIDKEKF